MILRVSGLELGQGVGKYVFVSAVCHLVLRASCFRVSGMVFGFRGFGFSGRWMSGFSGSWVFGFSDFRGWGVTSSETVRPWVGKKSGFVITRAQMVLFDC